MNTIPFRFATGRRSRDIRKPPARKADGEQPLGLVAFLTRVLQRNRWIDANGERLLFSAKPVSQSPQLAAVCLDQQMKSATVRELDGPIGRLGVAHAQSATRPAAPQRLRPDAESFGGEVSF